MKEKLLTLIWLMLLPFVVSKASAKMNGISNIPDSIPIQIEHYQDGMPYCETRMVPYVDNGIPEQNPQVNSQGPKRANTGKTTWTIGSGGNFADINAAMADSRVVAGDVLELKPSTILTGTQTISKAIHLKGNGYEMDSNGNLANNIAQLQGYLQIRAEGARVSNLAIEKWPYEDGTSSYHLPSVYTYSSNSIIEGSYLNGWIYAYADNVTIRQCFFKGGIYGNNSYKNCMIHHNIISSSYTNLNGFNLLKNMTNATIDHNIFYSIFGSSSSTDYLLTSISSSTITNNIIVHFQYDKSYTGTYNGTITSDCLTNNTLNHNVFTGSSPNSNNRGGVNAIGDIFDYTKYVSSISRVPYYDACFHLVANSPATGYATDAGDCGPWSGTYPYVVGGTVGEDPDPTFKDGDVFTAQTAEGVEMTFKVISASEKTCQVGNGESPCIDRSTTGAVTIPSSVKGLTVTSIGEQAFRDCSGLTSVIIPNSVTSIGYWVFGSCSDLISITIPNSVTSIGSWAFEECSGLTSVTIPNSVTSIDSGAFSDCSGLTSIIIPNSVISIGWHAFLGCSGLASIKVETGNTKYDSRNNCNAIIETATNTLITGCQNTIIPNSVTSISDAAFFRCSSLTSVTIPSSVTSIGDSAFMYCNGLTSITIPNSVTSIGSRAFLDCSGLTSVISEIQEPFATGNSAFSGIPSDATLYVPAGTVAQYRALADWNRFTNITEIQDTGGYTKAELQAMLDAIGQRLDAIGSMINDAEAMYKNLSGNYNISDDVRAVVEKEWSRMSSYIDKYNEALKGYDVLKQQVQAMTGNDNGTLYNMIVALQTKIDQAEDEARADFTSMMETIKYYAAEDMERRLKEMAENISMIYSDLALEKNILYEIEVQLGDYYFMRKGTDEFLTKIEIAKARLEEAVAAANVADEYYKYLLDHHSITTIEDIVNFYTGYADLQSRINNINEATNDLKAILEVLDNDFKYLEVTHFPDENLAYAIRPTELSNGPQIGYKQSLGFVLSSNGMMWFEQKEGADFYLKDADGHYIVATSDGTTQAGTKAEATVWTGWCEGKGNYTFRTRVNYRYVYLGCNGTNENSALTVSNTNYSWTITEFKQDQDHDYDWSIGSGGDFADVNSAMSDSRVKDGDVLQVLNGTILNGTTYITKAVTIKGNGYEDKSDGHIYGIYIDCEGVTLKNLHNGYIYVRANNATIERCRTSHISGRENYESDDVTIRGCLVLGYVCSYYNNISYGWKISNNIIIATNYWGNALDYLEEATIDHNLIINYEGEVYGLYAVGAVNNSSFTNNIFLRPTYSQGINDGVVNSATKFEYNIISNSGTFAKWPTNITGYNNMAKLFECSGERTTDTYYKLVAGSPALGYANDGGDCGPWSGAFPYLINGKESTTPEPDPTQWKLDPTLTTDTERYEFATLDALFNFMLSHWSWYKEGMTDVTVSVADATYTMDVIPNINTSSFSSVDEIIKYIYYKMAELCEIINGFDNACSGYNITFNLEAQQRAVFQFNLQNSQAYNTFLEFMAVKIVDMQAQGMSQEEVDARKAQWFAQIKEYMYRLYEAMLKFASHIKTTNIIIFLDNTRINPDPDSIEPNDLLALKNIYNMLGGSSWTNKKWKINDYGAKKEDFPGVTFDDEGYVVEINLENNNLRGSINPTGWTWQLCLPRLTGLYLQKNNISGDLSPWLKGVNRNNRLKALNMSYNNLTEISDSIPSSITSLNLENQNREWYRPDGVYTDPLKIEAMSDMTPIRLYLSANQTVVMPSLFTYNHASLTHSARPTIYIINAEGIDKYGYFKSSGEDTYSLAWKDNEYTEKQNAPCYVRFDNPYGSVYPAYLRYIEGDANMSGYTDVLDVQTTLNYVLNGGGVWQFNRSAANTYEDNLINVQDIVCMVNIVLNNEAVAEGIILNTSSSRRHLRRAADAMDAQGWLYTEKGRVMLTTVNEVGAIDLELKGVSTSQVSLLLNHSQYQMIGRNTEDGSRYVIFSPTGQPIPASEEVALLAVSSQTELIGAQAADMEAQELELAIGQPTGLEAIDNGQLTNDNAPIYNVAGQRLSKMQRGINITNGRKVLK